MSGLINPCPWRERCRAGYSNTGGPLLPRKRAPCQKNVKKREQKSLNKKYFSYFDKLSRIQISVKKSLFPHFVTFFHAFPFFHGDKYLNISTMARFRDQSNKIKVVRICLFHIMKQF